MEVQCSAHRIAQADKSACMTGILTETRKLVHPVGDLHISLDFDTF
jgi:hypothetical protein